VANYLVIYDLVNKKPEAEYQTLWDELKRLGAHRTQYSSWIVNLNNTAKEIVEHFKQFVHSDDRIMVTRLTGVDNYYVNAIGGTNKWLEQNVTA
jgi:CRISPR-associated endonuclease Cas2